MVTVYCLGFALTSGLQLGGALHAVRAGARVEPRDIGLTVLNSVLWFVFLPSVLYPLWRRHRARRA